MLLELITTMIDTKWSESLAPDAHLCAPHVLRFLTHLSLYQILSYNFISSHMPSDKSWEEMDEIKKKHFFFYLMPLLFLCCFSSTSGFECLLSLTVPVAFWYQPGRSRNCQTPQDFNIDPLRKADKESREVHDKADWQATVWPSGSKWRSNGKIKGFSSARPKLKLPTSERLNVFSHTPYKHLLL